MGQKDTLGLRATQGRELILGRRLSVVVVMCCYIPYNLNIAILHSCCCSSKPLLWEYLLVFIKDREIA